MARFAPPGKVTVLGRSSVVSILPTAAEIRRLAGTAILSAESDWPNPGLPPAVWCSSIEKSGKAACVDYFMTVAPYRGGGESLALLTLDNKADWMSGKVFTAISY